MRKIYAVILMAVVLFTACESPVKLTGWKNPQSSAKISKVVIMPLFEKLEYMKPFENSMTTLFNQRGLTSVGSLEFLNPEIKYPLDDIKKKCDSLHADAILVFVYESTDKTDSYIPPTTYVTGGYGGYWGGGYWGGYYGGYYGAYTTTGGYWTTTSVINLSAKLYVKGLAEPLWTAQIAVTDPEHVDKAGFQIADAVYVDLKKNSVLTKD